MPPQDASQHEMLSYRNVTCLAQRPLRGQTPPSFIVLPTIPELPGYLIRAPAQYKFSNALRKAAAESASICSP